MWTETPLLAENKYSKSYASCQAPSHHLGPDCLSLTAHHNVLFRSLAVLFLQYWIERKDPSNESTEFSLHLVGSIHQNELFNQSRMHTS